MTDEPEVLSEVNLREYVIDALTPLLPDSWTLYPYAAQPDSLTGTTVWLIMQTITRAKQAPQGIRMVTFTLTVATPVTTIEDREDDLGESIIDILNAIDDIDSNIVWTTAEKGMTSAGNLGYDINLTVPITKTASPDPEESETP